jgi:hypothetical protein
MLFFKVWFEFNYHAPVPMRQHRNDKDFEVRFECRGYRPVMGDMIGIYDYDNPHGNDENLSRPKAIQMVNVDCESRFTSVTFQGKIT